jgi:hypothetical protein
VAGLAGTDPEGTSEGMEPVETAEVNEPVAALTVDDEGWISMLEGTAVTMAGFEGIALAQIPTM